MSQKITGYVQAVQFSPGGIFFSEINLMVGTEREPGRGYEGVTYTLDGSDTAGGAWTIGEGICAMRVGNWGLMQYLGHATRKVKCRLQVPDPNHYDTYVRSGTFVEETP
jgi:hypothetical protein